MSKTLEELEAEYDKAREAYFNAKEEAAMQKYSGLVGKWVEVSNIPWDLDEEKDEQMYRNYKNDDNPSYMLVEKVVHVTPMSSDVDCVHITPSRCAEVLSTDSSGFLWKTYKCQENFYTNRYKVVDANYVAEALKKVTLRQIEATNKIIKEITQ